MLSLKRDLLEATTQRIQRNDSRVPTKPKSKMKPFFSSSSCDTSSKIKANELERFAS